MGLMCKNQAQKLKKLQLIMENPNLRKFFCENYVFIHNIKLIKKR